MGRGEGGIVFYCSHLLKRPRQEVLHEWMTVDFIVSRHDAIYGRHKTRFSCQLRSVWSSIQLRLSDLKIEWAVFYFELASNEYDNQLPFLQVLL